MAFATAEGRYVLIDRASPRMRAMRREAVALRRDIQATGRAMDRMVSPRAQQRLDNYRRTVRGLGRTNTAVHQTMRRTWADTTRQVMRDTHLQERSIAALDRRVVQLGRRRARPDVNVNGVGRTMLELQALEARLRRIDGRTVTTNVRPSVGSVAAGAGRAAFMGGGGGGRRGLIRSVDMGPFQVSPRALGVIAALGLPGARALLGGAGALAGSAGAGALGLGALGLGGGVTAGAGGALMMATIAPMADAIGDVNDAIGDYNDAVREFGRGSEEAAAKHKDLMLALDVAPRGTRTMLTRWRALGKEWAQAAAPAQTNVLDIARGGIATGRRLTPQIAAMAEQATGAVEREAREFRLGFVEHERTLSRLDALTDMWDDNLDDVRQTVENILELLLNIAVGSRAPLKEAITDVRELTGEWARGTRNVNETGRSIEDLVDHTRTWLRLGGSAVDLLDSLFSAGAPEGQSTVERLTNTLDRWDAWVESNPHQTRQWFSETAASTEKIAGALADAVVALEEMGDMLSPLLDHFTDMVRLASDLGLLQPGALALAFGAYRGVRGSIGGRGPGGGAPLGGGTGGGTAGHSPSAVTAGLVAAAGGSYLTTRWRGAPGVWSPGMDPSSRGKLFAPGYRHVGTFGPSMGAVSRPNMLVTPERFGAAYPQGRFAMPELVGERRYGLRRLPGMGRGAQAALRGAARAAWPLMLGMGVLDFMSFEGGVGEKFQAGLSGMTAGLIDRPSTDGELSEEAAKAVDEFLQMLPVKGRDRIAAIEGEIDRLSRQRGLTGLQHVVGGGDGSLFGLVDVSGGRATDTDIKRGEREVAILRERLQLERRALKTARERRGVERGRRVGVELAEGYDNRVQQMGPEGALRHQLGLFTEEMAKTPGQAGKRELAAATVEWAREIAKGNPEMEAQVADLEQRLVRRFGGMGRRVAIINGQIKTGTAREWDSIQEAITSAARRGVDKTSEEFRRLRSVAVSSLVDMGFSRGEARELIRGGGAGEAVSNRRQARNRPQLPLAPNTPSNSPFGAGPGNFQFIGGRARGGRLAGVGWQDTVPMADGGLGAPGEAVVNRHSERDDDRDKALANALFAAAGIPLRLPTLDERIRGETRSHAMPYAPRAMRARGGRVADIVTLGRRLQAQGYQVGEHPAFGGVAPVHTPNSHHYRGAALDINADGLPGGEAAWLDRLYQQLQGMPGVVELLWRTAGHHDHLHVAMAAGAGVGAFPALAGGGLVAPRMPALRSRRSGLGGIPGAMADRAGAAYAAGLTEKVNERLAGGVGMGVAASIPSRGALTRAQIEQLWVAAGGPPHLAPLMAQVAWSESRWNPSARNPSGASGLWQIMMPLHAGLVAQHGGNVFDPMTNARVAVALYRTAGMSPWAASQDVWAQRRSAPDRSRGGRLPFLGWAANGADIDVSQPALIGVGDRPGMTERVQVTPKPKAGRSRGHRAPLIAPGAIVIHADGADAKEVQRLLHRELEEFVGAVVGALENGEEVDALG